MQTTVPDHPVIRKMEVFGDLEPYEEIEKERPSIFDDLISDVKFMIEEAKNRHELYNAHQDKKGMKRFCEGAAFENETAQNTLKEILNLLVETKEIEQAG